jgi:glutamate racemase
VGRVLEREGLRANGEAAPAHRFYATDDPQQMLRLGQRFLGGAVERVETLALG